MQKNARFAEKKEMANKTVTIALSRDQYQHQHMAKAIAAHRKVEGILKKMCAISE